MSRRPEWFPPADRSARFQGWPPLRPPPPLRFPPQPDRSLRADPPAFVPIGIIIVAGVLVALAALALLAQAPA